MTENQDNQGKTPESKRQRTNSANMGDRSNDVDTRLADLRREVYGIETDIALLNDHQGDSNAKINLLTSIVSKQAQLMGHMHSKLVIMQKNSMRNNILIHNIPENDDEDVIDTVRTTLEHKVQAYVDVERAHRMGPRREQGSRIIVARLSRQDEVEDVLAKTRPPKGTVYNKFAIRVTPQIPNELRHARAKMHYLADQYRSDDNNVKIKVHENKFTVDGVTKRDKITPPSAGEILSIEQAEMNELNNYKFICSDEKVVKSSRFRIYSHPVRSLKDVRRAYKAISAIPEAAKCTHLISAYKLQGNAQGYQDDGDFGFGQQILRTIVDKEQDGYVFFLTRQYGGIHLGRKRFQIVHELIK
jgi:hypothetical protein